MYNKKVKLVDEETIFPSGTITKLFSRYQPERASKFLNLKGGVDKNNEVTYGVVKEYNTKTEEFKIKLDSGEDIYLVVEQLYEFLKLQLVLTDKPKTRSERKKELARK